MTYALFLDRTAYPQPDDRNWIIARSFDDAVEMITSRRPSIIAIGEVDYDMADLADFIFKGNGIAIESARRQDYV